MVSLGFIGFHWNFIGIHWSKRVPCWSNATRGWILGFLWTLWIPHPHKSTLTCAVAEALLVLWWLKLFKCSFYRATILLNLNTVFDKSFWDTASFSPPPTHPPPESMLTRHVRGMTHPLHAHWPNIDFWEEGGSCPVLLSNTVLSAKKKGRGV